MTYIPRFPSEPTLEAAPLSGSPVTNPLSSICGWIGDWIKTTADYYAAAATYERLSMLSDTELQRRGLSRATLARDICNACDRTSD